MGIAFEPGSNARSEPDPSQRMRLYQRSESIADASASTAAAAANSAVISVSFFSKESLALRPL